MIDGIPIPARDGAFEADFWAALDAGILAHQRCTKCRRWHFPPRFCCSDCGGTLVCEPVSGLATLWSFTVVHPPVLPAFAALAPYVAAVVELDEQPGLRMVGNIVKRSDDPINAVHPDELHVGMKLRAIVVPVAAGLNWPKWILAEEVNS